MLLPVLTENWFRLPDDWFEVAHLMQSREEQLVVEYILKHTWGRKRGRVSIGDLRYGFVFKGRRIDNGTHLGRQEIEKGLKLAVEDGFLVVQNGMYKPRYKQTRKESQPCT